MLSKSEKKPGGYLYSSETPTHITIQYFLAHYWPNYLGARPNMSKIA